MRKNFKKHVDIIVFEEIIKERDVLLSVGRKM